MAQRPPRKYGPKSESPGPEPLLSGWSSGLFRSPGGVAAWGGKLGEQGPSEGAVRGKGGNRNR